MPKSKLYLKEIFWLLSAAILALFVCLVLFGTAIFSDKIDINLHDTYLVTPAWPFFAILFIIFSFTVYLIKEKKHSYKRKSQNIITIFFGIILILILSKSVGCITFFTSFGKFMNASNGESLGNGWTVYPPVQVTLKNKHIPIFDLQEILCSSLLFIQLIIIFLMINLAYKWGKQTLPNS
ncbi:hypothetical protein EZ449_16745 [Pedobacter frigidisoli]|uniref:Uncharacterized protein n=1 Tax=Pedobacter frigidisoli TaxID=2530455 RepID=A0A4R0NTH3_9SPHI|nr:hypothetical protein [Pedobacter frigidisoli]TCD04598.1 hypothetical protein EZ449_16745 [Pedobacter frigidisoli]